MSIGLRRKREGRLRTWAILVSVAIHVLAGVLLHIEMRGQRGALSAQVAPLVVSLALIDEPPSAARAADPTQAERAQATPPAPRKARSEAPPQKQRSKADVETLTAPAGSATAPGAPGEPGRAAPADATGTAPSIDWQAARRDAATYAARNGATTERQSPRTKTTSEKLGESIAEAGLPACKDAYPNWGLLAIFAIAHDSVSNTPTCRW